MSAKNIKILLRNNINPQKAKVYQSFFKTGPGEYGEGDVFLGVTTPELKKVVKKHLNLKSNEISNLLHSKIHEERAAGITILTEQSKLALKRNENKKLVINARFYLKEKAWVNNWDLVDLSAPHVLGPVFYQMPNSFTKNDLIRLSSSKIMWHRRIAILTTFYFIRQNEFRMTKDLCRLLLNDKEDLMHKACGWMLREVGKRDMKSLCNFLDSYVSKMPRTMLRYSIEKFPEKLRLEYLNK
jgi:3-methyladenine DNA glycosylase AlkD